VVRHRRTTDEDGGSTPVPTVAMDCGLLESRLDRLEFPDRGGSGAMALGLTGSASCFD
jgi:hypothetical protein